MPPSRPYLDMITRTLGINPRTVLRQGAAVQAVRRVLAAVRQPRLLQILLAHQSLRLRLRRHPRGLPPLPGLRLHLHRLLRRLDPGGVRRLRLQRRLPPHRLRIRRHPPRQRRRHAGRTPRPLARHRHPGLRLRLGRLRRAHGRPRLRRHHQLRPVLQPRAAGGKIQPDHLLRGDRAHRLAARLPAGHGHLPRPRRLHRLLPAAAAGRHRGDPRQLVVYRPAQRPRLDLHRRCARPARRRLRAGAASRRLAARLRAGGRHRDLARHHGDDRLAVRLAAAGRAAGRRVARAAARAAGGRLARPGAGRRLPLPLDARRDRIRWHGVLPEVHPLRLRIAVPFVNQVRDGFAEACTIEVGGEVLAPALHGTRAGRRDDARRAGGERRDPAHAGAGLAPRGPRRPGRQDARPGDRGRIPWVPPAGA